MRVHMGNNVAVHLAQKEAAIILKEAGSNVPCCFSGETLAEAIEKADEYLGPKRRKAWREKFKKAVCLSPAELP